MERRHPVMFDAVEKAAGGFLADMPHQLHALAVKAAAAREIEDAITGFVIDDGVIGAPIWVAKIAIDDRCPRTPLLEEIGDVTLCTEVPRRAMPVGMRRPRAIFPAGDHPTKELPAGPIDWT